MTEETTYPSPQQFERLLFKLPAEQVVRDFVFRGDPYVFRSTPHGLAALQHRLTEALNVHPDNITVVGSGRTGFSLSPDTFGQRFSDRSDVDVVVVDEPLFDHAWTALLKWNYPWRYRLTGQDRDWARRRMEEVYWGWLTPARMHREKWPLRGQLATLRDFTAAWFGAFRGLARELSLAPHDFTGRLYRTWDHALLYHAAGLRRVRDQLSRSEEAE